MMRITTGLLDFADTCFGAKAHREFDQKISELKKAFPEPFSIERRREDGETFIRIQFAEPHDSKIDLVELEKQIRKATGSLPVRFVFTSYRSISKLFAELAALAQDPKPN